MKNTLKYAMILMLLLTVAGCSQPVTAGMIKSDKPHISSPDISPGDEAQFAEGNSTLACDLYQALRLKPEALNADQ
jgi:hypothetical protein